MAAEITKTEIIELEELIALILYPEDFGCAFDKGDPATYQERAGKIIDAGKATIHSLRERGTSWAKRR